MRNQTKIHIYLYKPLLFMGCERLPFTFITLLSGLVIIEIPSLVTFIFTFGFYLVVVNIVRNINKTDPQFFHSMYRYLVYLQDYYPVHAFYSGNYSKSGFFIK